MVEITVVEGRRSIDFKSIGHLDIKDLCGILSINIRSCYYACSQKQSAVIKTLFIDYNDGVMEFEVKKSKEIISYLNMLIASIGFINFNFPNSIKLKILSY